MRKSTILSRSLLPVFSILINRVALVFLLPALCFLLSCGGSGGKEKGSDQPMAAKESANNDKKDGASSSGCSRLIFFRPGAEIDTRTFNAAGDIIGNQHTRIDDVKQENGMTVAYAEGYDKLKSGDSIHVVKYSYKCDGNKIYFDLASLMGGSQQGNNTRFQSTDIEYPIAVKEGETLPDVTSTINMESRGRKVEVKMRFTDRKVEAKENVTTPAGSWDCYRISHITRTEMDMPGVSEKQKELMQSIQDKTRMKTITWLAPDFGIVKMEMYIGDRLASRNEVTAYKN